MALRIITNNVPRQTLYGYQLPKKVRKDFDYLSDEEYETHDFVYYRGNYYDISEFMRIDKNAPEEMQAWQGYTSETFFSGVLIRFCENDQDYIIMGMYVS